MKIFAVIFSVCFSVSLGCSLPKYSPCDMQDNPRCSCAEGLACKVTREIDMGGQTAMIKQCMPDNEPIVVERLSEDDVNETLNPGSTIPEQAGRFYPGKECTSEAECLWPNTCCMFNKRCGLKLMKYFTCYFKSVHKCGCMDDLVCKTTTHVTLPDPVSHQAVRAKRGSLIPQFHVTNCNHGAMKLNKATAFKRSFCPPLARFR